MFSPKNILRLPLNVVFEQRKSGSNVSAGPIRLIFRNFSNSKLTDSKREKKRRSVWITFVYANTRDVHARVCFAYIETTVCLISHTEKRDRKIGTFSGVSYILNSRLEVTRATDRSHPTNSPIVSTNCSAFRFYTRRRAYEIRHVTTRPRRLPNKTNTYQIICMRRPSLLEWCHAHAQQSAVWVTSKREWSIEEREYTPSTTVRSASCGPETGRGRAYGGKKRGR